MFWIPLHTEHVDLHDPAVLEALAKLPDGVTLTQACGRTVIHLYTEDSDPVAAAMQAVREIRDLLPQAKVIEVDLDVVCEAGIAHRTGIAREQIAAWVCDEAGPGGFPQPCGFAHDGSGLRRWVPVALWLAEHYMLNLETEQPLTREQTAKLNLRLAQMFP